MIRSLVIFATMFILFVSSTTSQAATFGPSEETRRAAKKLVRDCVVDAEDLRQYGLRLDKVNEKTKRDGDTNLVVLLHGFNSSPERTDSLGEPIRQAGFQTATFCYPNDHSIAESAKFLATELADYAKQEPKRNVTLVAHSMGGLVARAAVEDPALDPGNVDQLIMVATPNHGTMLAHVTKGADLWEHGVRHGHGGPIHRLRASVIDGLAEAVTDVKPGSEFLIELNGRERNPRVRYSLFLGTDGPVPERGWTAGRKALRYSVKRVPYVRDKVAKYDEKWAQLDEFVDGRGDGVVSVRRGRLAGVEDTVVLHFSHLSVAGEADEDSIHQVHAGILARVEQN